MDYTSTLSLATSVTSCGGLDVESLSFEDVESSSSEEEQTQDAKCSILKKRCRGKYC